MAQVDFSNAVFSVVSGTVAAINPILTTRLTLDDSQIVDSANTSICTNNTNVVVSEENKELKISYSGTFTASGTEFYFSSMKGNVRYKVSNITFSSGDTYAFSVRADLSTE